MKDKIKGILKTATLRQTVITLMATGANGILAVVFYLTVARLLGAADYGIFTLAYTTMVIGSTVLELGTDRGLVKFISKYRQDRNTRLQISNLALMIKLTVGILVLFLSYLLPGPLAALLFHRPELGYIIPLIAWGIIGQQLFFFSFYYMQAYQKFIWWGSLMVGSNLLRLVLVFSLFYTRSLNTYNVILIWALTPLLGFFIGLITIDKGVFTVKNSWSRLKEIFHFNKWVSAFSVVSSVSSRIDTYVTADLTNLSSVGIYGLGSQAVAYLPQIIAAVGAVTTPKFASFSNADHNRRYVFKASLLSLGIALLAALAMIPGGLILFYISGRQYTGGFLPYLILLLSMLIFLVTGPVRDSLLYFFNRPQFFFWASLGNGIVTIITGILLIPSLGILGSALSNLFGQLFLSVLSVSLYLRLINFGKARQI